MLEKLELVHLLVFFLLIIKFFLKSLQINLVLSCSLLSPALLCRVSAASSAP